MTDKIFEIETFALPHVACAPQESGILLTDFAAAYPSVNHSAIHPCCQWEAASTAVVGLYLVRSVLEWTCKEFLSRCVGRLGVKTVKASRARKRGLTTPRTTCWKCSCSLVAARQKMLDAQGEEICLVALSCHFALDVIFLSMEY